MSVRPDLLARLEDCAAAGGPGAVYLLPHATQLRFKVGWSIHPMQRMQKLPEYPRELDLNAAEVAWFARAQRARQVERVLHRSLAPYSVDPGHFGAGCTEWFSAPGIVPLIAPTTGSPLNHKNDNPTVSAISRPKNTAIVFHDKAALLALLRQLSIIPEALQKPGKLSGNNAGI